MARIAEPEKIEEIKRATMEALIEHGFDGMSIASISEKAHVSPGYLYRYYSGKEELVRELVDLYLDIFIKGFYADMDSSHTASEAAYKSIYRLLMQANDDSILAKFTSAVVMDIRVPSSNDAENFKNILELAERFIKFGIKTGEINPGVKPIEVVAVPFTIPFRYISISLEADCSKKFTQEEAKRITEICINAMK